MKSEPYEVGWLLNCGPKPEITHNTFKDTRKSSMNTEWTED
jgi:hypothetical protein